MKAIETQYKGYRFRSRLEARWAVFFDRQGIAWEYEKEGYNLGSVGLYLPDFWLPQVSMWAEVKPVPFSWKEIERCWELQAHTGHDVVLLDGAPDFRSYFICSRLGSDVLADPITGDTSRITDGGYPGGDYEVAVPWEDVIVSNGYLSEHRFYANTGYANWPNPWRFEPGTYTGDHGSPEQYQEAVYAARSARFEHGERP